jgi:hypothetical protein
MDSWHPFENNPGLAALLPAAQPGTTLQLRASLWQPSFKSKQDKNPLARNDIYGYTEPQTRLITYQGFILVMFPGEVSQQPSNKAQFLLTN